MPKAPTPKEIRDRFSDYANEWRDIHEEAKTDMRYVAGDPWEPADRRAREDAGRPCISLDMLGQYLNQCENNIRQTELAIQVLPVGDGANDQTSQRRENIIRGIDYRSNGQAADITAFQGALQRSYGFSRLVTEPVDAESFDLEIRVQRIPNPDCVLFSPDYKEADASDVPEAFITDLLKKKDYKRKYPNTKVVSFESEYRNEAPLWIRENYVQVGEFWRVHKTPRKLLLVDVPLVQSADGTQSGGPTPIYEDELKEFIERLGEKTGRKAGKSIKLRDQVKILRERETENKQVMQYLTNGIEIIDEKKWAGTRIPILACFGKELFLDEGVGAKRMLLSMVRLARDPQMLYAYLASQECEEAGMTPKAPFVGYKGQFESDAEVWKYLNKIPAAMVQVDVVVDGATGQALPLPTRPSFQPNFQAYEVAKDSASRSLQAAMGISPLPTAAQRRNEKSGVALEKIQTAEDLGSYHFTDNYKRYLHNKGWQINELIPIIYDMPRWVPVSLANGKNQIMRINDRAYEAQFPDKDHLHTGDGDFDVTISTGPSYQSQREAESEFADFIISNAASLGIPQPILLKIVALAVRMKNVGATGNEIAELLDPPDPENLSPQAKAQIQTMQAQMQDLQTQLAGYIQDRAARVLEQQTKVHIEGMKIEAQGAQDAAQHVSDQKLAQLSNDIKVLVAEITAKSQDANQRAQMYETFWKENHKAAHEVGMQAADQAHEHSIADKQAAAAQQQQEAQGQQSAQSQAADQVHQQSMASQAQENVPEPKE